MAVQATAPQTPELGTTLQHKIAPKNEIIISRDQLREVTSLFTHSFQQKPGWLRTRFVINQRRRKVLNEVLWEAGLDGSWCDWSVSSETDDWASLLHQLWHAINDGDRHECRRPKGV